jgi:hypothetical protein
MKIKKKRLLRLQDRLVKLLDEDIAGVKPLSDGDIYAARFINTPRIIARLRSDGAEILEANRMAGGRSRVIIHKWPRHDGVRWGISLKLELWSGPVYQRFAWFSFIIKPHQTVTLHSYLINEAVPYDPDGGNHPLLLVEEPSEFRAFCILATLVSLAHWSKVRLPK